MGTPLPLRGVQAWGGGSMVYYSGVHRLGEAHATKVSDSSCGNLLMGHRTRDQQVQHGIIDKGPKRITMSQ